MYRDYIKKQSALFEKYYNAEELAEHVDIKEFADALEDAETCTEFYNVLFYSGLNSGFCRCTITPLALNLDFGMDDVAEFLDMPSCLDYTCQEAGEAPISWGEIGEIQGDWTEQLFEAYRDAAESVESHFLWLERNLIIEEARKAAHVLVA